MTYSMLVTWLVEHIAGQLGVDASDVDIDQPFAAMGLTSIATVGLSGDLEQLLSVRLATTLVWDHPNIDRLARHLSKAPSTN